MIDYRPLIAHWRHGPLAEWAEALPAQAARGLSTRRYGDLARWLEALDALPQLPVDTVTLDRSRVGAHAHNAPDAASLEALTVALQALHPWRKGPFELFGVHVDTEWRSDWKWDRLLPGIAPLAGRRVLDVGCGNGDHCWRMLGEGAAEVIGVDPSPLFVVLFWAMQQYLRQDDIWVLPAGIADVPAELAAFDTVFSMGVLYHRRSPLDHLAELRGALRPGGQLVLETLVIEGGPGDTLLPADRYARMGNVWFLPSCDTLLQWLARMGFEDARVVDVNRTTTDEQRSTDWMRFHSLAEFLDPQDAGSTIEGYPAPRRAIITAERPDN